MVGVIEKKTGNYLAIRRSYSSEITMLEELYTIPSTRKAVYFINIKIYKAVKLFQ